MRTLSDYLGHMCRCSDSKQTICKVVNLLEQQDYVQKRLGTASSVRIPEYQAISNSQAHKIRERQTKQTLVHNLHIANQWQTYTNYWQMCKEQPFMIPTVDTVIRKWLWWLFKCAWSPTVWSDGFIMHVVKKAVPMVGKRRTDPYGSVVNPLLSWREGFRKMIEEELKLYFTLENYKEDHSTIFQKHPTFFESPDPVRVEKGYIVRSTDSMNYEREHISRDLLRKKRADIKDELLMVCKFWARLASITSVMLPYDPKNYILAEEMGDEYLYHDEKSFKDKAIKDVQQFDQDFLQPWYKAIVEVIKADELFSDVPAHKLSDAYNLIKEFIRGTVISIKEQTIERIIAFATDRYHAPKLHLKIRVRNGQLDVVPKIEKIMQTFIQLILEVAQMANNFCHIDAIMDENVKHELIKAFCTDIYIRKKSAEMADGLMPVLAPLREYCQAIALKYAELDPQCVFGMPLTISDNFNELKIKLEYFEELKRSIHLMPDYEYINTFRLDQIALKHQLSALCSLRIREAAANATNWVTNKAQLMTIAMRGLSERAKEVADTTEEHIKLGKFMAHGSTNLITSMYTRMMDITQKYFNIQYGLTTENLMAIKDMLLQYNELDMTVENYKSMFEMSKKEREEIMLHKTDELNRDLEEFVAQYLDNFNELDDDEQIEEYKQFALRYDRMLELFEERVRWINKEETDFNTALSTYPELDEIKSIVSPFIKLILFAHEWSVSYNSWINGPLVDISADEVNDKLEYFLKNIDAFNRFYKNVCKQQVADNYPKRFKGYVDDPDSTLWPAPVKLISKVTKKMMEIKHCLPVFAAVCSPALQRRHWEDMTAIVGFQISPSVPKSLREFLELGIEQYIESIETISVMATKESTLLEQFIKMKKEWDIVKFTVGVYGEHKIRILGSIEDIQILLDDHIVKTLTMRGSAYVKPIETEVRSWFDMLSDLNTCLEDWSYVQIEWLHLYPIFTSPDIAHQMPRESVLYKDLNGIYEGILSGVVDDPSVLNMMKKGEVKEKLKICRHNLGLINVGVNRYLEKKRLFFPRFFFMSNDGMLEILSETENPLRVQPYLKSCFEGIAKLGFDKSLNIYSMFSDEGEEVHYVSNISTKEAGGRVELWLIQVEKQMTLSVRHRIHESLLAYSVLNRKDWINDWQGQVVLCVCQIYWTSEMHAVFARKSMSVMKKYSAALSIQLNTLIKQVRMQLPRNVRVTIEALVVLDIHGRDVVVDFCKNRVTSEKDFQWQCQLRYYWEKENVKVRIINASINYAYEYLGNTSRLVITPLTDRCYRTLVGAYNMSLNGAPEGPAGTGKTETTKDLAKALAVQCIVFNCSDGLDYLAMSKFFKGLASCGAWACFDEFNRIDIEVLSVIAQQILCITQAVRSRTEKFMFEGTMIRLNPAVYVCITMNPGYAGRSELPDNLKVLFRSVAMMVPDYAMIGEITLFSHGYLQARELSVKIVSTYRLCSELLSSQSHYDYGMRAVKTVLSAAGNLIRKLPNTKEDELVLRSLIDVNLPKFLDQDIPLFTGIISDLFPSVELTEISYGHFLVTVNKICANRNLQPRDAFVKKIIQTYEMMIVRHGFMLVGNPFGGKTSVLRVLSESLTLMFETGKGESNTYFVTCNPKSVTMGQLYGHFDEVSHEWHDGIIANYFRQLAIGGNPEDRKWLVFDGPVDAEWIENMNTVLDDNKKLCLNSGEVIQMRPTMSMIFEVMDLVQASPATVSRCGMIYMEPNALGWRPFVESWNNNLPTDWKALNDDRFLEAFDWLIPPLLKFVKRYCKKLVDAGEINAVKTCCQFTEIIMNSAENMDKSQVPFCSQASFLLGIYWGLGGAIDSNSIPKYDEYFKQLWNGELEDYPVSLSDAIEFTIPPQGVFFDHEFKFQGRGLWVYRPNHVKATVPEEVTNVRNMMVTNKETMKFLWLMELYVRNKVPFLLTGPTGTGKSRYIQYLLLNKLPYREFHAAVVTFSPNLTANHTQELIISKLSKKRKGIYGPPAKKSGVIFIDDINVPVKEKYGAQPPLELLRQFFDHNYWFDLLDTTKITLLNTHFIAAMGLPGGCKQHVYARFLRHFNLFAINAFSAEILFNIFSTMLFVGFRKGAFTNELLTNITPIVNATLNMYQFASENLLPTPDKPHYIFNMRDVLRVISGVLLLTKDSLDTKKGLVRLWVHEILREFYDRLIDPADRKLLFNNFYQVIKEDFHDDFEQCLDNLEPDNAPITEEGLRNLIFTNATDKENTEHRKYEELASFSVFEDLATNALEEYNSTHRAKLNIVLFRNALEHLSRLSRILSTPSGCALLVGVNGTGRQSLTYLAADIYSQGVFKPEISNNYGITDWRRDLKTVIREAGGRNRDMVFLCTESQIKEEAFLQDIDALLNSGEVPNLFDIDELEEVLEMFRQSTKSVKLKVEINPMQFFNMFISRNKMNLHIVLSLSSTGSSFRNRVRMFPSLVNCCTIDWYESWPEEALERVAMVHLVDLIPEKLQYSVMTACKVFHMDSRDLATKFFDRTSRRIYITPASYLELNKLYQQLLKQEEDKLAILIKRYQVGLEKLEFAADQVTIMQTDLEELRPKLKTAVDESLKRLATVEAEKAVVDQTAATMRADEKLANLKAEESNALKIECEQDLAKAIPILEDAIAALNTLKPNDITLVKSMKNPPAAIKLVMAAICVMKDIKPDRIPDPRNPGRRINDYWGPSKRMLGDMAFLQSLKDYDKDNIPPFIMDTIRRFYLPHKDFHPKIVAKASSAAEGLCKWVIAMDKYDKVVKMVAPKKAKLNEAEKAYAATIKLLNEKRAELARLQERLARLNAELDEANMRKKVLEDDIKFCSLKLETARIIIGNLGGEHDRWEAAAKTMQKSTENLIGDTLMSSAIIAYLAPVSIRFRKDMMAKWHTMITSLNVPSSQIFNMVTVLGNDIKIEDWNIRGLPSDTFSTENAIIMDYSRRWPLFIDPQGQANKWIKELEKANGLMVIRLSDPNYMRKISEAVPFGKPVLLENVGEDLDAPLNPILLKSTFKQGRYEYIALGETVVEYDPKFKFYITTKLKNPHYLPRIFSKITVINFSLSVEGLTDQLLGIVVSKERPELQKERQKLILECAKNKKILQQTEDDILVTLATVKGNILENETAVMILENSKTLAATIFQKQMTAVKNQEMIENIRLAYKPNASYTAILYYTITDLSNVDPMYQFSLNWFINIYVKAIQSSKSYDRKSRNVQIQEEFVYSLYINVCRSLFDKDKTLYSFILCTTLLLSTKTIEKEHLDFLITGGIPLDNPYENPASEWLPQDKWDEICRTTELPSFERFRDDFIQNIEEWKTFYTSMNPTTEELPSAWRDNLTSFQQLILVRIFRPDQLIHMIVEFITDTIGLKFVKPPAFDLRKSYNDSNSRSALICILSPGVDPMHSLLLFANAMNYNTRFHLVSLGQGQGPKAEALISKAVKSGDWVCLQNCHLALSWLPRLELICESLLTQKVSKSFRLWLTSYPTEKFPNLILQEGVKITNEAPTGLKENLLRSYNSEPLASTDFYESCPSHSKAFTKLLFGIAFFHAVVQERGKFGPIGWNIAYGFNESDFHISVEELQMYIQENEHTPYDALLYLIGECNYGGRVTDYWDRRTLNTLLRFYVNQKIVSKKNFNLCKEDRQYIMPTVYGYKDFVFFIENLPKVPSPVVYGLHKNSGITRNQQLTNELLTSFFLATGEGGQAGSGDKSENILIQLIVSILEKLPENFDLDKAIEKYPTTYSESMNTVLVQEMKRFNDLYDVIKHTLNELLKAIKGAIVMTLDLESLANSLMIGRIPANWVKFSYPSLKRVGAYIADFRQRLLFFHKWYQEGKPTLFWLSGFFFTQAFLTGTLQNYARFFKIPIDHLDFDFEVLKEDKVDTPPSDGVIVFGLFIDGARWEKQIHGLEEQYPLILTYNLPYVWIKPMKRDELDRGNRYLAPLYKTSERKGVLSTTGHSTNFVLPILLDTEKPSEHWIKRGVALLCQLDT
ncbi:dynein heavy chain at 62B isoform X2 [Rhodnius prolixus]|uniref:dynein heavy chain at 62B isoform X2 n=1 Tax=Rhodnius prolixus TaxID=13249 RepID=UPI003D18B9C7